jgi:TPR repeat protein
VNLDRPRATLGRVLRRFARDEPAALRKRAARSFARNENATGVANLLALADRGDDPKIAFQLGDCYERGVGVVQNFVEAVRWYELAATRGVVSAMSRLGDIYLSGRLVNLGGLPVLNTSSPVMLGRNRLRPGGLSVPQDFTKALYWNRAASEKGDAEAQARLGGQLTAGLGVNADFE